MSPLVNDHPELINVSEVMLTCSTIKRSPTKCFFGHHLCTNLSCPRKKSFILPLVQGLSVVFFALFYAAFSSEEEKEKSRELAIPWYPFSFCPTLYIYSLKEII